eukprot:scaffold158000_cov18-Tisochrysis_lutea.AAC.1
MTMKTFIPLLPLYSDQRAATGGTIPADSEAATATVRAHAQRLANRALRAADREAVRDRDDYAMATYGTTFSNLTAAQMEDVSNYMRDDEKRTKLAVFLLANTIQGVPIPLLSLYPQRQADLAYAATPAAAAAGTTYLPTQAGVTAPTGTTTTGIVYDTTTATTTTTYDATYGTRPL